jgi:uncharacterized protein
MSCSSNPIKETKYYLLNNYLDKSHHDSRTSLNNKVLVESNQKIYHLKLTELPEYLNQPYLVMQLDQHQLHYARFHMWAEPLHDGIGKALINDLNKFDQSDKNKQFVLTNSSTSNTLPIMHVEIESFHASNNSIVILSGHYWINSLEPDSSHLSKANLERRAFYFETHLQEDGYTHSVFKMRSLINKLSNMLLENL